MVCLRRNKTNLIFYFEFLHQRMHMGNLGFALYAAGAAVYQNAGASAGAPGSNGSSGSGGARPAARRRAET